MIVNGAFQRFGTLSIPCGLFFEAQYPGHALHCLQDTVVNGVRAQAFRPEDVDGLHPARIALLAPVDERTFAAEKPCGLIVGGPEIVFERTPDDRVNFGEPCPVARDDVDLPRRERPDHAVARTGPRTAGSRVLDDAPQSVDLAHQRDARYVGDRFGQRQQHAVTHVACPDPGPQCTCSQCRIGFDVVDHLIDGHVVKCRLEGRDAGVCTVCRNVVLLPPDAGFSVGGGVVRDDRGGAFGISVPVALADAVVIPGIGVVAVDELPLARAAGDCGEGCEQDGNSAEIHGRYLSLMMI